MSGNKAAEKSYKVEAFVRDGFEDPSGSTDIELGDGVNIFLAGDSYSHSLILQRLRYRIMPTAEEAAETL